MKNYSLLGPILILLVAFVSYNLTNSISLLLGVTEDVAGTLGIGIMLIVTILAYIRIRKTQSK